MRHLILTTVISLFLTSTSFCQTATSSSTEVVTETVSYTTPSSTQIPSYNSNESSSVSIKNNNVSYKLTAKFNSTKMDKLKKALIDNLGKPNTGTNENTFKWSEINNEEKVYDCKLTDTTLKLYMNKKQLNTNKIDEITRLGNLLKDIVSNTNSPKERKNQAERELALAKRNLALAERELALAKRRNNK